MKKISALLSIAVLISTVNINVFSQKVRTSATIKTRETGSVKSETTATVKLRNAAALSDGNGVYIKWQADYEVQNLGFYIYRVGTNGVELASESITGGGALLSTEPVAGRTYSFFDPQGDLNNAYYIESYSTNGARQIVATVKSEYVNDLTPVAGATGDQLVRADRTKPSSENNFVNLPKGLSREVAANTLPPDPMMQRWVAAQPGVKIGVRQEGIYRVSRSELEAAGFNVNAPGNLWQLWVDGKQQAINVGANDSYIEFYGVGIDTPESGTKVYYLLVGNQNGRRMETTFLRSLSGNVAGTSYNQSFYRRDRVIYISADVLNGDEENFFGGTVIGSSTNPVPFTFSLSGVDFTLPNATFELKLQGLTVNQHQASVTLNGEILSPMSWIGKTGKSSVYEIPTSYLREGTNTITLASSVANIDQFLTNSIKVTYFRKFESAQNRLSFYTNNYRQTTVSGFSSPNIRLFDLTNPESPSLLSGSSIQDNGGSFSVVIPSNRGRAIYAAEDSAIQSVSSIVQNIPSTFSTPEHNGQLIIVTHKDWMTQANDWANYRRGQGITVEVVDVEDIFDEFGYGSTSTSAMTRFFEYAKDNWQTAPGYILLIGDATYDFRNYENRPFLSYVPTKLVDTLYEETGSDEALADFNNDGLSEIAIGRIPARNGATVTQLLNKTMMFESTVATAHTRGATFAFDEPNGYDFEELSHDLGNQLPNDIPKSYIRRLPSGRSLLIPEINTGRYLVNYSGHGSFGGWDAGFFTNTDAIAMTNSPNYSMYFMLTCLNGYFLITSDSLGETLLKAPNGGAVSVWASTGKTTPDVQRIMAVRFYNQLGNSNMDKLGDLVKDAKTNLFGGRDVRLSWALLGDPTLRVK